ncbi:hypothetical protein [Tersicoccus sp. Bi-70]|uniref:hypothetical protein n=1 Tax=Tersicoccus sp. Bi-70 TaxID=1897634 RepID=UPI000977304D|nr:hypothetical protein [Tersicoccus sp. Bi-70]OMH32542.1 hypothetical protein BGP79_06965 [Tersicoccus sp. Bi-70]
MSTYAWTIDTDHLAAEGIDPMTGDATGTTGPSTAPDNLLDALRAGAGHHFTLYDDDAIPYYSGRAIYAPDQEGTEDFRVGPLRDYGAPNAGCTLISWTGHPEWDSEY